MFSDMSMRLYQYIETLQEPFRFIVYMTLLIGVPILILGLLYINKKVEDKKNEI